MIVDFNYIIVVNQGGVTPEQIHSITGRCGTLKSEHISCSVSGVDTFCTKNAVRDVHL
jgi:hypothetical protein